MVNFPELLVQLAEVEERMKNVNLSYHEFREIEIIATRLLGMFKRFSGSEDADATIMKLQKTIAVIRMTIMTWQLFERTTGPIGWTFAAVSAIGTALMVGDMMMEVESH